MKTIYTEPGIDARVDLTLVDQERRPLDLTDRTVSWKLYDNTGTLVTSGTGTVISPTEGLVSILVPGNYLVDGGEYRLVVYATDALGTIKADTVSIRVYGPETLARLYVKPSDVELYLGMDLTLEEGRLVDIILKKMDYVDRLTSTTWNGRVKTGRHLFSIKPSSWAYVWMRGYKVQLPHMHIREIREIRAYRGSTYQVVYPGEWTEGRGTGDFWLDREHGMLHIQLFMFPWYGLELEVEYTYGRDDLPEHIREYTLLLVARDILVNERRYAQLARGEGLNLREQLEAIESRLRQLEGMIRGPLVTFL